jgi:hypothetical protein
MIFSWDLVTCDDFGDCHDKIDIAGGQFVAIICKGWDAPRHSQQGHFLWVIDLVVDGR